MSDFAKGAVKFAAIAGAIYLTGGAAGLYATGAKWTAAALAATVISGAIAARGMTALIDPLSDGVIRKQVGIQANPTGTEVALPIIYGKAKVGMSVIDVRQGASDVNTLALVGAIAVAPEGGSTTAEQGIEAVTDVYFNELRSLEDPIFGVNIAQTSSTGNPTPFDNTVVKSPWNGNSSSGSFGTDFFLEYFLHDGDDSQVVDYALNDEFSTAWGATSIGKGVAYLVLWLYYSEAIYTNGVPNVTMEVKGNKVLDCQSLGSDAAYSTNPADCIRDFMTSTRYGMGIPVAQIDATSFAAAAVYCDADDVTITIDGGDDVTLPARFTCNGFLMSDDGPISNLERLLSSCCGRIVREGGEYKLLIRKAQSAETFELDRTNIVGDWSFIRTGIDETPNTLVATYVDVDLNYSAQPVTWPEPDADPNAYLVADHNYAVESRIELSFTENRYMAEMIASQQLLERRADFGCALVAQREALKLSVGDVVNVTHDTPSWTVEPFWVEAISLRRDGLVQLALKSYAVATYTVPTMTVKPDIVVASLPARYTTADGPTVQVTNFDPYGVEQATDVWWCRMNLSFSAGMGSYQVTHDPAAGSTYSYTVTPFTGTDSGSDYLLENPSAGPSPFEFSTESGSETGISTITVTPYPEASLAGIAGPPLTVTFQPSGGE
jgi:hypothetical protein